MRDWSAPWELYSTGSGYGSAHALPCYRRHTIPPPLRPYIRDFYSAWYTGGGLPQHVRIPDGCLHIVMYMDLDSRGAVNGCRGILGGLSTYGVAIPVFGANACVMCCITPGAVEAAFGLPANELAATRLDLEAVMGHAVSELCERMCYASDLANAVALLQHWLGDYLVRSQPSSPRPDPLVADAIGYLWSTSDCETVRALGRRYHCSPRTLRQRFARAVGMGPKAYLATVQRRRALALLTETEHSLEHIALACGHFDQAHFTHAFRRGLGTTPARYRKSLKQGAIVRSGIYVPPAPLALPSSYRDAQR